MNVYGLVTMTSVLTIFINDVDDFIGQLYIIHTYIHIVYIRRNMHANEIYF